MLQLSETMPSSETLGVPFFILIKFMYLVTFWYVEAWDYLKINSITRIFMLHYCLKKFQLPECPDINNSGSELITLISSVYMFIIFCEQITCFIILSTINEKISLQFAAGYFTRNVKQQMFAYFKIYLHTWWKRSFRSKQN